MDNSFGGRGRVAAVQEFRHARRKADLRSMLSKLTGKPDELLVFDDVRRALNLAHPNTRRVDDIPLDAIVGSVNRYVDFNRKFYPLSDSDEERWAKVKQLVEVRGLEPIEVYQVGDVYFVLDGNHRVSVARQLEAKTIQAYVTEFRTEVDVEPEDDIEDVVLKAEYKELMEDTHLDEICPELEFTVTVPGRYREILEHIQVHRYYMGIEQEEEIPLEEAAASWVYSVYLPAIDAIRELNILDEFPDRTETDLYLWLKKHQWELEQVYKREVGEEDAAIDLRHRFSNQIKRRLLRLWQRLWGNS